LQEENLKTHIFTAEIRRIVNDKEISEKMKESAKNFFKPGAADQIAEELLAIAISHQKLE